MYFQVGFDALYFSRIDYQDRQRRKDTKSLEVVWRGSKTLGSSVDVCSTPIFQDLFFIKVQSVIKIFYLLTGYKNVSIQIFTGIFPKDYEPPPGGFYFEVNAESPVIQVIP